MLYKQIHGNLPVCGFRTPASLCLQHEKIIPAMVDPDPDPDLDLDLDLDLDFVTYPGWTIQGIKP